MAEFGNLSIAHWANELSLRASVTPMHRALLASYRMNAHRGEKAARDLILSDLRGFLDLGALDRATDLLIVLALFIERSGLIDGRLTTAPTSARRQREPISLQRWRNAQPRAAYSVNSWRGNCLKSVAAPNLRLVPAEPRREPKDGDDDARR